MSDFHFFILLSVLLHIDFEVSRSAYMWWLSIASLIIGFLNSDISIAFVKGIFK